MMKCVTGEAPGLKTTGISQYVSVREITALLSAQGGSSGFISQLGVSGGSESLQNPLNLCQIPLNKTYFRANNIGHRFN
jgi:hypothetical protein